MLPTVAQTLLLASCAYSFRTHFTAIKKITDAAAEGSLLEEKEVPFSISTKPLALARVDMNFMTDDFRYQARKPSVWGWVKRTLFGGRRQFTSLKDELAAGHVCNKVGERDQTYYASSLCYWIPEIKDTPTDNNAGAQGPGLKWVMKEGEQQLCKSFTGSGQCVKCAVCHNNGRSKDGNVSATAFQENEVMALPPGCMKELQIERAANDDFDGNHSSLYNEKTDCETKEAAYVKATSELEANRNLIQRLNSRIRQIPGEISAVDRAIMDLGYQLSRDDQAIGSAMSQGQRQCAPFSGEFWYQMLGRGPSQGENALNAWPTFTCRRPRRPYCNEFEDPFCGQRIRDFAREEHEYHECNACKSAKGQLSNAVQQKRNTRGRVVAQQNRRRELDDELNRSRSDLDAAERAQPALIVEADRATQVWKIDTIQNVTTGIDLTTERWCTNKYAEYNAKLRAWMVDPDNGVPTYWDRSCEKACVTSSLKDAGCGVMEGVMPGDIYTVGNSDLNPGLRTVCSPPFTSFVRTPVKYGAAPQSETEICSELFGQDGQRPRRANAVLFSGTLIKRERLFWRWRPRWFLFEGGNQARSAQIRYWSKHPSESTAIEANGVKAITLWDARSVESVPGTEFRWKDGSECFRLNHFYRDYRLCVPGSEPNAGEVRDKWIELIRASITFPSQFKRFR